MASGALTPDHANVMIQEAKSSNKNLMLLLKAVNHPANSSGLQ